MGLHPELVAEGRAFSSTPRKALSVWLLKVMTNDDISMAYILLVALQTRLSLEVTRS